METYKAHLMEVIKLSIIILLSLSTVLYIRIQTMNHFGYSLILVFVLGYIIFNYLKERISQVVVSFDKEYVELTFHNILRGSKKIQITAHELRVDLKDKVGSRGFTSKQVIITYNGGLYKITGEKEGWTNSKVEELSKSLLKLKEL